MTSSDTEIHESSVIISYIKRYYSSLYKRRSTKNDEECLEYLRSFNLPQISSSERESCEGLVFSQGKSAGNPAYEKSRESRK